MCVSKCVCVYTCVHVRSERRAQAPQEILCSRAQLPGKSGLPALSPLQALRTQGSAGPDHQPPRPPQPGTGPPGLPTRGHGFPGTRWPELLAIFPSRSSHGRLQGWPLLVQGWPLVGKEGLGWLLGACCIQPCGTLKSQWVRGQGPSRTGSGRPQRASPDTHALKRSQGRTRACTPVPPQHTPSPVCRHLQLLDITQRPALPRPGR